MKTFRSAPVLAQVRRFSARLLLLLVAITALAHGTVSAQTPVPLADLNVGSGASTPQHFVEFGGKLYFTAITTGGTRRQLFRYDADQPVGSQLTQLSDFNATASTTNPNWVRVVGNKLAMIADGSANRRELWVYDPAANTFTEMPLDGTANNTPGNLLVHEEKLYFSGFNGNRPAGHGTQLYVYDPALPYKPLTDASPNPKRLTNLNTGYDQYGPTTHGCAPTNLVGLPGHVLFSAQLRYVSNNGGGIQNNEDRELVVLDTATGNVATHDLAQGFSVESFNGLSYNNYFDSNPLAYSAVVANTLYFTAEITQAPHGAANLRGQVLMKFNPATMSAPAKVAELNNDSGGNASAQPAGDSFLGMIAVGTKIYYIATDGGTHGYELRVCDTATDTVTLTGNIAAGSASAFTNFPEPHLTAIGSSLYFAASSGSQGYEPWRFNTTTGTANQLADVDAGAGNSSPGGFLLFDGRIYFRATSPANGTELYAYDPSSQAVALVADLNAGSNNGAQNFNITTAGTRPTAIVHRNALFYQGANATVGAEPFLLAATASIEAAPASASEASDTPTTWTIKRLGSTTDAITINFSVGGTATYGSDFTAAGAATFSSTAGSVTMASGVNTATFTTTPLADANMDEADETVLITLVSIVGPAATTSVGGSTSMTIINVQGPPPAPKMMIEEGGIALANGTGVNYGVLNVGADAAKTFTIRNTGTATLYVSGITPYGTHDVDYVVNADEPPLVIAPAQTATFTVTFAPTAGGTRTSAVYVESNDPDVVSFAIPLTGTGNSAPVLSPPSTPLPRQQGTAAASFSIGTAQDGETAAGDLVVTVVQAPAGILITNIVNNSGVITAEVAASCSASVGENVVVLEVSDGSLSNTPTLFVHVTSNAPPTLTYSTADVVSGGSTTAPPTVASDNGEIATFAVYDSGTYTGTIEVAPNGTVSISNAAPSGSHSIIIRAIDNCGLASDAQFALSVNEAPQITSSDSITFGMSQDSSFTVVATGYPQPTLSYSGSLPAGISFDAATGALSGTPTEAGAYPITFTASNGIGVDVVQSFTLTVTQPTAFTSANAETFRVGTAGSFQVTTSGFPVAAVSVSGDALPFGLTFVDKGDGTATLSGMPAAGTGGVYDVMLTAINGVFGSRAKGQPQIPSPGVTQEFTLTIEEAPVITSADSATFVVGNAGKFSVTSSGYPAPKLSAAGALPAGISFNPATGVLSGAPGETAAGVYPIEFTAGNGVGSGAVQIFNLTVQDAVCVAAPADLVAWYPGDGNAMDVQGGNHGTAADGATFANAKVGQAFAFDGENAVVHVPNATSWEFAGNDFTVQTWVNFSAISGSDVIAAHSAGAGPLNKWIYRLRNGYLEFHLDGSAHTNISSDTSFVPAIGQWYHVAITRSGTTWKFYVDGAQIGTDRFDANIVPAVDAPLTLGKADALPSLHGMLDEMQIFSRPLSSSEIAAVHAASIQGFCVEAFEPISAASRKTHGAAGDFELALPFTGEPAVECRSGGVAGDHTIVFEFNNPIAEGDASVSSGSVKSVDVVEKKLIVHLTSLQNAAQVTVTLGNLKDAFAQVLPELSVRMDVLLGDVNGNKAVNASDISQVKASSGNASASDNFRLDVNADGAINASDLSMTKAASGTRLP